MFFHWDISRASFPILTLAYSLHACMLIACSLHACVPITCMLACSLHACVPITCSVSVCMCKCQCRSVSVCSANMVEVSVCKCTRRSVSVQGIFRKNPSQYFREQPLNLSLGFETKACAAVHVKMQGFSNVSSLACFQTMLHFTCVSSSHKPLNKSVDIDTQT